ncbi:HIT family hydrolase [Desulfuromonas soudanensis]|uniref:HIT family hydrolase n=1 Tax=Desulfuromonas soudanensis TaxID=1603606 RepID=A0A0M4D332_9BACT|nr:histidine triad nucleotide-binding protein [Desulfuromonas soudanensis]ALC16814.1 HIT family hydrolase [Desulfuromonas soudanensis]
MSDKCIFCKIIAGEIPGKFVYEDEEIVAFGDLNPQAPHHYLIVPRKHIRTTLDLTTADNVLIGHIHQVAGKLAHDLGFAEDGFRLVNNCNEGAGQSVWHIHFHLLGGRDFSWPPG